ncbi:hypothetical protein N7468_000359 [Penicillium chermesinum]|uniref:Nephrocystin 3-like N-terminal domain-containing protein n=1 Tax=Penicillium chermesinum TaxID=63820 RepID=A0A9W9PK35_9EURO|nr:uncharacterized protein N7468_000359 [Penicillium chermesinum]KAJ5248908.1 hypothetical protein N7468_000359 [Penicillium chermesinum]
MAPGIVSPVPGNHHSAFYNFFHGGSRQVSGVSGALENDNISQNGRSSSRRESFMPRKPNGANASNLTSVVQSLYRRSGDELGASTSSKLLNSTYHSLVEWIRVQRMSHLPPEGSSYDKVLAWAQLFIERLHHFDEAIHDFAGDSGLATQLSYGYCGMLLDLGKENADALMISFGFFYSTSSTLVNLLERTELFAVSQEIKEQLILALADLVTLVHSVSTHFHQAISGLTTASVSVNIYDTFPGQIQSFKDRCRKIAEAMWRHQLSRENIDTEKGRFTSIFLRAKVNCLPESSPVSLVKSVHHWLAPEDGVLARLAENTSHLAHEREENTCLWVGSALSLFLKKQTKTLAFSGKPGSGKTVAASVLVDRLQDPIGSVTYKTLFVPINARIPAEATAIAVAKTILHQLFEKRIGNIQLLQILSEAYEQSRKTTSEAEYEDLLWHALHRTLGAAMRGSKELIIIVDGIDEATCGEAHLFEKLTNAVAHTAAVRLITLGGEKPKDTTNVLHVPINEERNGEDVSIVVRSNLEHSKVFREMSELEQETIIDEISEAAHGSFLWAKLCANSIRHEHTAEDLHKVVETVISSKLTITDFVQRAISSHDVTDDARHMLLWLATGDRPFQVKELLLLASVDVHHRTIVERKLSPVGILKPLDSLILFQDGQVYFRHGLIRSAILDVFSKGKLVPTIKDRHADLVTRLLIYIKTVLPEQHEPSLSPLDYHDTNSLIQKHPLLEFSVRYWYQHLTQTTVFKTHGEVHTAKEFGKVFPSSVTLLLLQNTVWSNVITPQIAQVPHYYLQLSMITLAMFYRGIELVHDSIPLVYEITTLSKTLLTTRHLVTMKMANIFLELTTTEVTSSRTEIMIKREEIYLLLVECYKIHYGNNSENVVTTLQALIEHYRLTKEEKKIQEITVIIQSITGVTTEKDTSHGDLHVHLRHKRHHSDGGIRFVLDVEEDERTSEEFDFHALLQLAEKYRADGQILEAERVYVEIWQRASHECRIQSSSYWEEIKLESVIIYSKFLKQEKRETESSAILSSVWEEYRHSSLTLTEKTSHHFQEIATIMASVGLTAAALSIFKQCAHYYESRNQTSSSRFEEIKKSITTTSEHVMKSASSSSSTVSESTLEEIVFEASSSHKVDQSSFTATTTLVELYVSQHRWKDATRVTKKVLEGTWSTLFAASIQDVILPKDNIENTIELAERLCQCYHYRRRFTREENIRTRIYHAIRHHRPVDDKIRERITVELIRFFERTSQTDKVISTYQELLDDQVKHYGHDHSVVIKTLWTLAELTRPRPIFIEYYQRIIRALNKDSPHCKPEALEPLIIVATELWYQSRYSDAVAYFTLLFTTFLSHPKQPRFENTVFVQEIFTRYTHCLRSVRTDYSIIHKVTLDYYSKVKAVFGATASITIQATLTLARVCQESKRYEADAIALYEELLKIKSTEVDIEEISATLDSIYEEQTLIATSSNTTLSSSQVERASKVLRKRITTTRETHGWAHEESLSKLKEIVSFHSKHSETESVLKELKESTVQIISSERSSTKLVAAAVTIASSYVATKQVHKATEISQELYRQIIMKDSTNVKTCQFDLTSKSRQSLVFLAQFEHSLHQHSTSVTDILASLTTEYVYFEEFRSFCSSKSVSFHEVTISASRLYYFLLRSNRLEASSRVFAELSAYFLSTEGKRTKLTDASQIKIFLSTILSHFNTHKSSDFIRSVGIASNVRVIELLKSRQYEDAQNLALASFYYISSHEVFRTAAIVKFVFTLGKKLHGVSATIIREVLHVIGDLKISLAQINLDYLNILIGLLGEQKEYKTLVWLLGGLWSSRSQQTNWPPHITLGLARRYILARYLVGDALKASRLAEDIVYNCRRVNGARHSSTLEMSTLLTQLYTGIAQRYQSEKGGQHMANKYYKKAATVHENILRAFIDPVLADFEGGLDNSFSVDGSAYDFNMEEVTNGSSQIDGEHVRHHLQLLKLAVQRLGDWPKEYSEYERLYNDLREEFNADLEGVESVQKWNLKGFGAGKASSKEDSLNLDGISWELDLQQKAAIEEEEEEL